MNRHKAVDPVSELFSRINVKTTKSKFRKEISLLLIVGCIGCVGTMFIFNLFSWNKTPIVADSYSSITISNKIVSENQNNLFLEIEGDKNIGSELFFSIPNYNAKATYEIDFGDGTIHKYNSSSFSYQYTKAGAYPLKMNIHYKDQLNTIFEKILYIENATESELTSL